jgi:hypothetical protein
MKKRKHFNIHDLYPADYSFDWRAFSEDPEHYVFTKDDIAFFNVRELERYEEDTPMSPYERRALRKWVASGHSVMEAPPSRYACIHCCYPPPSFLDVYREDKMLDAAMKGMTKAEKDAYLKDYMGFYEEQEEERRRREEKELLHKQTPEAAQKTIQKLQRQVFHLHMFIADQGLSSEADEYMQDHMDTPSPFEDV